MTISGIARKSLLIMVIVSKVIDEESLNVVNTLVYLVMIHFVVLG